MVWDVLYLNGFIEYWFTPPPSIFRVFNKNHKDKTVIPQDNFHIPFWILVISGPSLYERKGKEIRTHMNLQSNACSERYKISSTTTSGLIITTWQSFLISKQPLGFEQNPWFWVFLVSFAPCKRKLTASAWPDDQASPPIIASLKERGVGSPRLPKAAMQAAPTKPQSKIQKF